MEYETSKRSFLPLISDFIKKFILNKQVLLCRLTKSFLGVATDDMNTSWIRKDFIKVKDLTTLLQDLSLIHI